MYTKVAIIGGSGKMGRLFARLLKQEGRQVVITGRDRVKLAAAQRELGVDVAGNADAVRWADAVVVSVSIDGFEAVIRDEVAPFVRPGQVVLDVTSLKEHPVEVMHRYIETATVLGTHPVFGPGTSDLKGQNFVLTPTSEKESALAEKVAGYLEARGAAVTTMTPRRHDELMTVVLGLAHFISLVSADTLAAQEDLHLLRSVSGNTFRSLVKLVKSVISEDPGFYSYLQMSLPGLTPVERQFQDRAKLWADLVADRDREEFMRRMDDLRKRLEKAL